MNRLAMTFAVAVAVSFWAQEARAEHDDECRASCGGGVQLTTLQPGDAHCPTGGVKITTPSCAAPTGADGDGEHEGRDRKTSRRARKGSDDREHGDGDHSDDDAPPPPPQVAYVCNGNAAPGGGGGDAYTTSNPGVTIPSRGPVPTPIATLVLPAGNYLVSAKAQLSHSGEGGAGEIDCTVTAQAAAMDIDRQRVTARGFATTALLGHFSTKTGDTVTFQCSTPEFFSGRAEQVKLVAHKVANLFSDGAPTPTALVTGF